MQILYCVIKSTRQRHDFYIIAYKYIFQFLTITGVYSWSEQSNSNI